LWTFKRNLLIDLTDVDDVCDDVDFMADDSEFYQLSVIDQLAHEMSRSNAGELSVNTSTDELVSQIRSMEQVKANPPSKSATVHIGAGVVNAISVNLSKSYVSSMLSLLPSNLPVNESRVESPVSCGTEEAEPTVIPTCVPINANTDSSDIDIEQLMSEVIAGKCREASISLQSLTNVTEPSALGSSSSISVAAERQIKEEATEICFDLKIVKCERDVSMTIKPFLETAEFEVSEENQSAGIYIYISYIFLYM